MSWPTQYTPHERVHCSAGSREHVLYTPRFDAAGNFELVESGKEDRYAEIQSHKDSCDINLIVERYASGDQTVLARRQAMYMDVTEMPKTYSELLNLVATGEKQFNSLPLEVKEEFGNSYHRYLSAMDSPQDFEMRMAAGYQRVLASQQAPAPAPAPAAEGGASE